MFLKDEYKTIYVPANRSFMSFMRKIHYIRSLSGVLLSALLCSVPSPAAAAPRKAPVRISPLSDSLRKIVKLPDSAARAAFNNFAKKTGTGAWRVRYSPKTALPEAIVGAKTQRYPGTPEEAAISFLTDNKDLLKVDVGQLRKAYSKVFMGLTHIQYEQVYNSIPVEFAYVRVHVDPSGKVTGYQAKFEPDINVPLTPAIPASYAESAVLSDLGFSARVTGAALVLFPDQNADGALKLAWKVRARAANTASGVWVYYVCAQDGKILFRYNDLRYACPVNLNANGTVKGAVYTISPLPVGDSSLANDSWVQPVTTTTINNQYVWVTSNLNNPVPVTTGKAFSGTADGEYCGSTAGKVFASLKGPYFSVVNFRGPSAHFDNGGGVWYPYYSPVPVESPHPYNNSSTYNYPVTVPDSWSAQNYAFAKVMPHFTSFSVGAMDLTGTINDSDELHVTNGANAVASYIGTRSQPFFGAPVENPTYGLTLNTNESGTSSGFAVDFSSYMVLTDSPLVSSNTTGSIVWANNNPRVFLDKSLGNIENSYAEVNAFYHLNAAFDYFKLINQYSGTQEYADLSSRQVPVMVHAHGAADNIASVGGMNNGFYDLENDNIFLGDGPTDAQGSYRSFALDGTIIRHEYTHRVINKIYPIINFGEFGAISEGIADYFSLASFAKEGNYISILGNFVGSGEGSSRDLSGPAKSMPASWGGEVHDDSLILSQALWQLRNSTPTTNTDLGNFGPSGNFKNMPKADVFTYAALFYFPDNFANFYDAFVDACAQLDPASCPSGTRAKIAAAFNAHGIPGYSASGDGYDQPVPGTLCVNNNGPECATDISTMTTLSATIYPVGDVDYYAIPLQAGDFTASLAMPAKDQDYYYAYALFLFDSARNYVTESVPVISNTNTSDGSCPISGDCLTTASGVSLSYTVPSAGRYYLVVSGAPNTYYGNSGVASLLPYTLNLAFAPRGSAEITGFNASYDQDTISFSVPYSKFSMTTAPSPSSYTLTNSESVFAYAQLRDHNYQPLADARTDVPSYLSISNPTLHYTTESGKTVITGQVSLNPGFAARYPGVGTVYLEIFGRDHMGKVISLGVSGAINLSTNKSDLVTYNNILKDPGDRTIVKYDLLAAGNLTIKIYTVTGSLVKTVFSGGVSAGKGTIDWDGTNSNGSKVASGIYYIVAKGPGLNKTDKIAVVR